MSCFVSVSLQNKCASPSADDTQLRPHLQLLVPSWTPFISQSVNNLNVKPSFSTHHRLINSKVCDMLCTQKCIKVTIVKWEGSPSSAVDNSIREEQRRFLLFFMENDLIVRTGCMRVYGPLMSFHHHPSGEAACTTVPERSSQSINSCRRQRETFPPTVSKCTCLTGFTCLPC